jgi:L-glyceraldehyde 3-phosphate reductase
MFKANENRYDNMIYRRCGKSGLKLSAVSLGLWKNFGAKDDFANMEKMVHTAFDLGIIHFDLANNYGDPDIGSAEENFGKILDNGLRAYRDELCISTKAGYDMWPGPYGERNGSRKYLIASLDQSLKRMGLDYVDVFYHHIADPNTSIEETAVALDDIVKQGKALYVGISNYNKFQTAEILKIFNDLHTPFVLNQPSYSLLNRWVEEDGLDSFSEEHGIGLAVFSPLSNGLLTNKYLGGPVSGARVPAETVDAAMIERLNKLNEIAASRGQSLSQMALSWILFKPSVATVLVGASKPEQIVENVKCIEKLDFTYEEIKQIDDILKK